MMIFTDIFLSPFLTWLQRLPEQVAAAGNRLLLSFAPGHRPLEITVSVFPAALSWPR